jgi:hypothetical protein
MAIRNISALPDKLPYARLYLNDIEEISKLILDAYSPHHSKMSKEELKIVYTVGDSEMDTISDLETLGGSSAQFEIRVEPRVGAYLWFYRFAKPTIRLSSLLEHAEAWAVYGQIKSIFDRRAMRVKNAVASIPGWILWLFSVIVISSLYFMPRNTYRGEVEFAVGYVLFLSLVVALALSSSKVYFVRFHEQSKVQRSARKDYAQRLIWLALGAAIYKLIDLIAHHFSAK